MKRFHFYTIVLLFLFQYSCKVKSEESSVKKFKDFKAQIGVEFEKVLDFAKEGLPRKLYLTDTTIIIKGLNTKHNYVFYEYFLSNGTLKKMHYKWGRGQGQVLGPLSSGLYGDTLWVNDITLSKFTLLDLKTDVVKEYPVDTFFFSVDYLGNGKLLATGGDSTIYKINTYDLNAKRIVQQLGHYTAAPKDIPFNSWRMGNEGFIFHNSARKKSIIALRYSDQIDFFNHADGTHFTIQGPDNFMPKFKPTIGYRGTHIMQRDEDTRFAYASGVTTDKYIYLLYSGNQHETENLDYGKSIFVFDWDGNAVLRINLPKYVSGFTVSKTNDRVYVSEPKDGRIYSFKINL